MSVQGGLPQSICSQTQKCLNFIWDNQIILILSNNSEIQIMSELSYGRGGAFIFNDDASPYVLYCFLDILDHDLVLSFIMFFFIILYFAFYLTCFVKFYWYVFMFYTLYQQILSTCFFHFIISINIYYKTCFSLFFNILTFYLYFTNILYELVLSNR